MPAGQGVFLAASLNHGKSLVGDIARINPHDGQEGKKSEGCRCSLAGIIKRCMIDEVLSCGRRAGFFLPSLILAARSDILCD